MAALSRGSSWFSLALVHPLAAVCLFPQSAWTCITCEKVNDHSQTKTPRQTNKNQEDKVYNTICRIFSLCSWRLELGSDLVQGNGSDVSLCVACGLCVRIWLSWPRCCMLHIFKACLSSLKGQVHIHWTCSLCCVERDGHWPVPWTRVCKEQVPS